MQYCVILIIVSIILNIAIRFSRERPIEKLLKFLLYVSPIAICLFLLSRYAESADIDEKSNYTITFVVVIIIFTFQVFIDFLHHFVSEEPYIYVNYRDDSLRKRKR